MAAVANPPTTATLTLLDLPDPKYRLRKPIVAEIEPDEAGYVVSEQSTGVFHYDPDFPKAIAGFFRAFVEQFEFLLRNEANLSPALQGELERFRCLLQRR